MLVTVWSQKLCVSCTLCILLFLVIILVIILFIIFFIILFIILTKVILSHTNPLTKQIKSVHRLILTPIILIKSEHTSHGLLRAQWHKVPQALLSIVPEQIIVVLEARPFAIEALDALTTDLLPILLLSFLITLNGFHEALESSRARGEVYRRGCSSSLALGPSRGSEGASGVFQALLREPAALGHLGFFCEEFAGHLNPVEANLVLFAVESKVWKLRVVYDAALVAVIVLSPVFRTLCLLF
ncbi:hypothetical protein KC316_g1977 [Hortaea werneckii]|nr:hypothetical protein KC324_g1570 [Hortaea werneckii]KAI7593038.1 hypothetical protein KC316_g1977 [Hortaea werneckii]